MRKPPDLEFFSAGSSPWTSLVFVYGDDMYSGKDQRPLIEHRLRQLMPAQP